jgi:hypothetical protein
MERLGHSSVTVSVDRYGHLLPSLDEALTEGLEDTFRAASADQSRTRAIPLGSRCSGQRPFRASDLRIL